MQLNSYWKHSTPSVAMAYVVQLNQVIKGVIVGLRHHLCTPHLKAIESGLSEEITYLTQVSTVHPHEGSIYGAEKVLVFCVCACVFVYENGEGEDERNRG